MKRLLATLVLLAGFIAAPMLKAQAQGPLEFDHMQIDIWPEYDQPSALVIYKITLLASTAMPAQVTLSIPKTAGQPSNVAMQGVDGMLYDLTYTTTTSGDWIKVSFTAPSQTLQVEYYDPGLVKNGVARSFQYMWPGDYKVNDMVMRIQQPINATQMTILPTHGQPLVGSDGLTYYGNDVGPVAAGTTFTYKINYSKTDDRLSVSSIKVQSQTPAPAEQYFAGGLYFGLSTAVTVGIVLLILIGGLLTWFILQRRSKVIASVRPRHPVNPGANRISSGAESGDGIGAIYCHQCGKRAIPGDVFCRICGSRLHI